MVAIIDYGVGNLFSLKSSLSFIGVDAVVTGDPSVIAASDRIILPGVGAFEDAANKLRKNGLDKVIYEEVGKGKKLLGICLGMQMLFEESYEYGVHKGLGLIKGKVLPLADVVGDLKVPHIGWNSLSFKKDSKLYKYVNQGDFVYFVHSFAASVCDDTIAVSENGRKFSAAMHRGNFYGAQFHPEKSGEAGERILRNFMNL